jgi:hypothetical protein
VYHGNNIWDYAHFKSLFESAKPLSPAVSLLIGDILAEKHSATEGSALLDSPAVLEEVDYFFTHKKTRQKLRRQKLRR